MTPTSHRTRGGTGEGCKETRPRPPGAPRLRGDAAGGPPSSQRPSAAHPRAGHLGPAIPGRPRPHAHARPKRARRPRSLGPSVPGAEGVPRLSPSRPLGLADAEAPGGRLSRLGPRTEARTRRHSKSLDVCGNKVLRSNIKPWFAQR